MEFILKSAMSRAIKIIFDSRKISRYTYSYNDNNNNNNSDEIILKMIITTKIIRSV